MYIGTFGCQAQGSRSQVKEVKVPSLLEAYWKNASKSQPQQWDHDFIQLWIFTGEQCVYDFFKVSKYISNNEKKKKKSWQSITFPKNIQPKSSLLVPKL